MNDKVSVQVVTFGAMNFAMQQNYVPLVRSVTIKNNSDEEIKDIMLKHGYTDAKIINEKRKHAFYSLCYSTKDSLKFYKEAIF